jgi:hypothetical protein
MTFGQRPACLVAKSGCAFSGMLDLGVMKVFSMCEISEAISAA